MSKTFDLFCFRINATQNMGHKWGRVVIMSKLSLINLDELEV